MSGTRNKLTDLNNHLFEQLERLNDDELIGEGLQEEIGRSKAVMGISSAIINNGSLLLKAQKYKNDWMDKNEKLPEMLENKENKEKEV